MKEKKKATPQIGFKDTPPKEYPGIRVELTEEEFSTASGYAAIRQYRSEKTRKKNNHGLAASFEEGLLIHLQGVAAEMAAAKALGIDYVFTVDTFKKADLGKHIQVKGRTKHTYELLVRLDDNPDHVFICVTGTAPIYYVRGWLTGREAMQPDYIKSYAGRPPAFFVPTKALNSMENFPHNI